MEDTSPPPTERPARNKRVVERYFHEVLDGRNFELLRELLAPGVVMHRPGFDVIGVEAAITRLRATLGNYVAFATELSGVIAEGELVAVRVLHRTRVRPHDFSSRAGVVRVEREQELRWAAIVEFRFEDGRIAEEWVMRDELGMLAQLGSLSVTAGNPNDALLSTRRPT